MKNRTLNGTIDKSINNNEINLSFQTNTKANNSNQKFNRSNLIDKFNYQPKFKSLFDREGNPFKYFKDIKKHLKSDSSSLL
jgi:hypothetical protein